MDIPVELERRAAASGAGLGEEAALPMGAGFLSEALEAMPVQHCTERHCTAPFKTVTFTLRDSRLQRIVSYFPPAPCPPLYRQVPAVWPRRGRLEEQVCRGTSPKCPGGSGGIPARGTRAACRGPHEAWLLRALCPSPCAPGCGGADECQEQETHRLLSQ